MEKTPKRRALQFFEGPKDALSIKGVVTFWGHIAVLSCLICEAWATVVSPHCHPIWKLFSERPLLNIEKGSRREANSISLVFADVSEGPM